MFTRRFVGVLAVVMALGVATVSLLAQRSVVVVLRSGASVSGSIVDMNSSGLIVDVNGRERTYGMGDIAAISFQGNLSASDWDVVERGTAVFVLRSGQHVRAELADMGGTTPLMLTLRERSGARQLRADQVSYIAFARPSNAAAPSDPDTGGGAGGGLTVAGNRQWTPTNITVRRGETVRFTSTGQIRLSGDQRDLASVNGSLNQRYAPGSPLPQFLAGALIGRIGNGAPFAIGGQTTVEMPAAGMLYLGINDDNVSDNAGHFNVTVEVTQRRRR